MKQVITVALDGMENSNQLLGVTEDLLSRKIADYISYFKINDGFHSDLPSLDLIRQLKYQITNAGKPIGLFFDLKIGDVCMTVENILKKYQEFPPDILTVSSLCSPKTILALRRLLPATKLALFSVPTDMTPHQCLLRYQKKPAQQIFHDLRGHEEAYWELIRNDYDNADERDRKNLPAKKPFDLIVCSGQELEYLRAHADAYYGYVVPGIRSEWMAKNGQERVMDVKTALLSGATTIVMGAQILKGNMGKNVSAKESHERTMKEIDELASVPDVRFGKPLEVLRGAQGFYESPKDPNGNYLGPVVAYRGTYPVENGSSQPDQAQYVGFVYLNFAKAEPSAKVRRFFAELIAQKLKQANIIFNAAFAAPMGGIALATALGEVTQCRTIFADKKDEELILARHEISEGEYIVIVEDVVNNISTAKKMKKLIENQGAKLKAIVCAFNRSGQTQWEGGVPIISACEITFNQFKQDHPAVIDLITQQKIVWKPKYDWPTLEEAMAMAD